MNKHIRENSCEIRHKSSDNENINNGMSEKVQLLANKIYKEFERLISFYGADVVEYLMPLIVNVLENLEELYRDKQSFEIELELLRDDNITLNKQYEKEKVYKKQAEERVLHIEYAYEEEKKHLEEKILTLESLNRLFEVKTRNYSETITRLEEKVQSLKTENQRLYERYSEILKSHAEQLNRIKAEAYRDISPPQSLPHCKLDKYPIKSMIRESKLQSKHHSEGAPNKISGMDYINHPVNFSHDGFDSLDVNRKSLTPDYISRDEETMADILSNDHWIADFSDCSNDNNNSLNQPGIKNPPHFENDTNYFNDHQEMSNQIHGDHSLEINNIDSDTDVTDDEFGIGREIDSIIHENQELVATKNALNIVKDDLISRLDIMTSDNDVLREDLRRHSNREADLKGKLSHLQLELKACKEEINKIKESENSKTNSSIEQKSFSRTEMAILLEEKNHYKEKLMELQDAVVYKEMCRVKKQFPEFKESPKPVKTSNSGIWNLFNHIFKKEEENSNMMVEKSRNLLSRFKRESDRSQLYSWSVPRSLIESELPKRIPIPIKIQAVFEQKDIVICATPGNEEIIQENNSAQYFWCLVQSNIKNNKNYYLQQMCLTGKVPELSNKYSINLQFPTIPFSVTEVPALNIAIEHLSLLAIDYENESSNKTNQPEKITKVTPTKLQMRNKVKHNLGSKTLWFACEKNQIVIYVLFDNNKIENRMAIVTIDSEIDFIKYNLGRVFVIGKNGSLAIFELNKEMNLWELNQCLTIDVSGGLPISDSSCDTKRLRLWLGSSTNCFIMDLSTLNIVKSLPVMEDSELSDHCTSIESMIIIEKYSLMLFSVSRIGLLFGYDLKNFQFKVSLDLKPSVFELIEPIQGIEKSTLSLFQLVVDGERIWMTSDCGMILVVTLDTIFGHMRNQTMKTNKSKFSLQTDKVYISSHAFAQSIKIISLLQYSNTALCLENVNSLKRFADKNISDMNHEDMLKKEQDEGEINTSVKTFNMMTAIGSSYVNLNCTVSEIIHRSNHAIIWKT